MRKLTKEEFKDTGLHESLRDHAYWDDNGYLVTVVMGSEAAKLRQQVEESAPKTCEWCRHGKNTAIQAGTPVICDLTDETMKADDTCPLWSQLFGKKCPACGSRNTTIELKCFNCLGGNNDGSCACCDEGEGEHPTAVCQRCYACFEPE